MPTSRSLAVEWHSQDIQLLEVSLKVTVKAIRDATAASVKIKNTKKMSRKSVSPLTATTEEEPESTDTGDEDEDSKVIVADFTRE